MPRLKFWGQPIVCHIGRSYSPAAIGQAKLKPMRLYRQKEFPMPGSRLWGGTIRKMWPTETDKFRDHLLRLGKDSRRLRFGTPVGDAFIADYASRVTDMRCLVHGCFKDGAMRAAAEMRQIGDHTSADAEGAFSVEEPFQNQGIGTDLLGRMLRAARNRGISRLYMNCLAENVKMQRIARKYRAELHFDHGEVVGRVIPAVPTYLSLWEEAVEDSSGFVMAVLELPLGMKPAA
jgi:GNAT superfamily N-acetyltransferase